MDWASQFMDDVDLDVNLRKLYDPTYEEEETNVEVENEEINDDLAGLELESKERLENELAEIMKNRIGGASALERRAPLLSTKKQLVNIEKRVSDAVGRYEEASQNVLLNLVEMDSATAIPIVYKNHSEMMSANKVRIDTYLHKQDANRRKQQTELHDASRTLNRLHNILDMELNSRIHRETSRSETQFGEDEGMIEDTIIHGDQVLRLDMKMLEAAQQRTAKRIQNSISRMTKHFSSIRNFEQKVGEFQKLSSREQQFKFLETQANEQYQEILKLRSACENNEAQLRSRREIEKELRETLSKREEELERITKNQSQIQVELEIKRRELALLKQVPESIRRASLSPSKRNLEDQGEESDEEKAERDDGAKKTTGKKGKNQQKDISAAHEQHSKPALLDTVTTTISANNSKSEEKVLSALQRKITDLESQVTVLQKQLSQKSEELVKSKRPKVKVSCNESKQVCDDDDNQSRDKQEGKQSDTSDANKTPASSMKRRGGLDSSDKSKIVSDNKIANLQRELRAKELALSDAERKIATMKSKHLEMVEVSSTLLDRENNLENEVQELKEKIRKQAAEHSMAHAAGKLVSQKRNDENTEIALLKREIATLERQREEDRIEYEQKLEHRLRNQREEMTRKLEKSLTAAGEAIEMSIQCIDENEPIETEISKENSSNLDGDTASLETNEDLASQNQEVESELPDVEIPCVKANVENPNDIDVLDTYRNSEQNTATETETKPKGSRGQSMSRVHALREELRRIQVNNVLLEETINELETELIERDDEKNEMLVEIGTLTTSLECLKQENLALVGQCSSIESPRQAHRLSNESVVRRGSSFLNSKKIRTGNPDSDKIFYVTVTSEQTTQLQARPGPTDEAIHELLKTQKESETTSENQESGIQMRVDDKSNPASPPAKSEGTNDSACMQRTLSSTFKGMNDFAQSEGETSEVPLWSVRSNHSVRDGAELKYLQDELLAVTSQKNTFQSVLSKLQSIILDSSNLPKSSDGLHLQELVEASTAIIAENVFLEALTKEKTQEDPSLECAGKVQAQLVKAEDQICKLSDELDSLRADRDRERSNRFELKKKFLRLVATSHKLSCVLETQREEMVKEFQVKLEAERKKWEYEKDWAVSKVKKEIQLIERRLEDQETQLDHLRKVNGELLFLRKLEDSSEEESQSSTKSTKIPKKQPSGLGATSTKVAELETALKVASFKITKLKMDLKRGEDQEKIQRERIAQLENLRAEDRESFDSILNELYQRIDAAESRATDQSRKSQQVGFVSPLQLVMNETIELSKQQAPNPGNKMHSKMTLPTTTKTSTSLLSSANGASSLTLSEMKDSKHLHGIGDRATTSTRISVEIAEKGVSPALKIDALQHQPSTPGSPRSGRSKATGQSGSEVSFLEDTVGILKKKIADLEDSLVAFGSSHQVKAPQSSRKAMETVLRYGESKVMDGLSVRQYYTPEQPAENFVKGIRKAFTLLARTSRQSISSLAVANWKYVLKQVLVLNRIRSLQHDEVAILPLLNAWATRAATLGAINQEMHREKLANIERALARSIKFVCFPEEEDVQHIHQAVKGSQITPQKVMLFEMLGGGSTKHVLPINSFRQSKVFTRVTEGLKFTLSPTQLQRIMTVTSFIPPEFPKLPLPLRHQIIAEVVEFVNRSRRVQVERDEVNQKVQREQSRPGQEVAESQLISSSQLLKVPSRPNSVRPSRNGAGTSRTAHHFDMRQHSKAYNH